MESLYLLVAQRCAHGQAAAAGPAGVLARQCENGGDAGAFLDRWICRGGLASVCALHGGRALEAFDKEAGKPDKRYRYSADFVGGAIGARWSGDQLLFENESYVEPSAWYRYDPATGQVKKTALFADFAGRFQRCRSDRGRPRFRKTARTFR